MPCRPLPVGQTFLSVIPTAVEGPALSNLKSPIPFSPVGQTFLSVILSGAPRAKSKDLLFPRLTSHQPPVTALSRRAEPLPAFLPPGGLALRNSEGSKCGWLPAGGLEPNSSIPKSIPPVEQETGTPQQQTKWFDNTLAVVSTLIPLPNFRLHFESSSLTIDTPTG